MSVVSRLGENGEIGNALSLAALSLQARLVLFDIPQSGRDVKHFGQSPFASLMSAAHTVSEKWGNGSEVTAQKEEDVFCRSLLQEKIQEQPTGPPGTGQGPPSSGAV